MSSATRATARVSIRGMSERQSLAVVVPAYNEGEGLNTFHARLAAVLDGLDMDARVIYVDDGSRTTPGR